MDTSISELEGRIEGLANLLLLLTAKLDIKGIIDDSEISAGLNRKADKLKGLDPAVLESARHALKHLADQLDDARKNRQIQAG